MKKVIAILLFCIIAAGLLSGCAGEEGEGYKIAVVPKLTSAGWFQRLEQGVKNYNSAHGTDYFYGGPTDAADQATYLEQLLAEDWDAICVVPFDPESIAPLLEKAKKEGILVITHEAESMDGKCFDYDVEAFASEDLGRHYGEYIVEKTGGKGSYVQLVGSLNSTTHKTWCDAADACIAANSGLVKIGRYESKDDMTVAYNLAKELMQAHPEITAIQCSCSTDLPGVSRAIEELGLSGKVVLTGTSLTSLCREAVTNGTVEAFSLWDPARSAEAMLALAEKVLTEGDAFDPAACSLPVDGYRTLTKKGNIFYGSARTDVTAANMKDYDF